VQQQQLLGGGQEAQEEEARRHRKRGFTREEEKVGGPIAASDPGRRSPSGASNYTNKLNSSDFLNLADLNLYSSDGTLSSCPLKDNY
jgi:hypothetical protein